MASPRSRTLAVLLTGALAVAAACSGDEPGEQTVEPPDPSSVVTDASGGEVPGTAAPDDVVDPPPSGDGGGSAATAPPGSTASDQQTPATTSASPAPAPGAVGAYAAFYLRATESSSLLVRVARQAGAEPRPSTLDHLVGVLGQVSGKTVDLTDEALPGEGRSWTAADIRALADAGPAQSRDRSVVHLFFLRGGFADSETALGVAVRSDVAAIFSDRVQEAAGMLGDAARIEGAVTLHEIGHLLGLVDLFLDTGRADPEHPGHSPNRESVMYWAVESTLVGDLLSGGPPRDFDQADLDDLARIRRG